MKSQSPTAPVSPWGLLWKLGLNAYLLSAAGVVMALAFIQSALRLSPAQLLEGLIALVLFGIPMTLINFLNGLVLIQPIYRFLDDLKQGNPPSPPQAIAVHQAVFRFAFACSIFSAALWYLGAAGIGLWAWFRADLDALQSVGFIIAGASIGSLTSVFNFFSVRRTLRPVQVLLREYLPSDDPGLLARPIMFRRKMAFSFTYLIVSVLASMTFELYYFQHWALLDQGLEEARKLVAQANQDQPPGQPPALDTRTGFGFRVRLFAWDAAGQVTAPDLIPAELARLRQSRYLLGRRADAEAHPLTARMTGWLQRLVLDPDHHLTRVEGQALDYLLPAPSPDGRGIGAVVELLPSASSLRRYPSVIRLLINYPGSTLAAFILSCLAFTLILTYLIIGDVAGPLRRLQATARAIREGDLNARCPVETNDEIGLLILDFNRTADRLAAKVNESEQLVAAVREATRQLGSNSGRIVEIATDQATGATEQAASIQQVSSTSEQIAATLKLISENARSVERVAGQTLEACRHGSEDIGAIVAGMDRLNSRVREIANEMLRLQEHALKIETILDLIREVSEKTNMISLNASIEAAAAGEAGRRFSIIAGEVRELAEQIGSSIREIQEMISLLQQATNRAIMVTEEGTKQVDLSHRVVGQVGRSFQNLTALADETASAAKEISLSSSQQTSAGEHLAATIAEINEVARSFVQSAREIESSTLELNRLAEHLRQMVGQDGNQAGGAPDFVPRFSPSPARKEDSHDQQSTQS
ncbi:MAG: methyl-accepting chemotaxis protein [Candidatus Methanoperedens sp.]|nr:methyl-accepting chemotaxis protein [Candidatus Methanoperedens sp.]